MDNPQLPTLKYAIANTDSKDAQSIGFFEFKKRVFFMYFNAAKQRYELIDLRTGFFFIASFDQTILLKKAEDFLENKSAGDINKAYSAAEAHGIIVSNINAYQDYLLTVQKLNRV